MFEALNDEIIETKYSDINKEITDLDKHRKSLIEGAN